MTSRWSIRDDTRAISTAAVVNMKQKTRLNNQWDSHNFICSMTISLYTLKILFGWVHLYWFRKAKHGRQNSGWMACLINLHGLCRAVGNGRRAENLKRNSITAGFEPIHGTAEGRYSSALDRSAIGLISLNLLKNLIVSWHLNGLRR